MRIDVGALLRERVPRWGRLVPRPLVGALERFIRQDELNAMLEAAGGCRGAAFCRSVIEHLDAHCTVVNADRLPSSGGDCRVVLVSNHPLGGLDGMMLIDELTRRLGMEVKAVVNDLLMAVEPLRPVFLPVNKHGRQSREAGRQLDEAFAGPEPLLMFPAGLCSRRGADGEVADLRWQKMFVNRCIRSRRDIIPLHFSGRNSNFFYNFADIRQKLGIRFNLEMTRLPAEVFLCRGKSFTITVGERIAWQQLRGGAEADAQAQAIRKLVIDLANPAD